MSACEIRVSINVEPLDQVAIKSEYVGETSFGAPFNRPRCAVSHHTALESFDDHMVAGDMEGQPIDVMADALQRAHQPLGNLHEFRLSIANAELREVHLDIIGKQVEDRWIASVDPAEILGRGFDATVRRMRHAFSSLVVIGLPKSIGQASNKPMRSTREPRESCHVSANRSINREVLDDDDSPQTHLPNGVEALNRIASISKQAGHAAVPREDAGTEVAETETIPDEPRGFLAQRQRAELSMMFNKDAGLKAKVEVSNGGLLSIAALVSSILLTTSVLVHVAVRDGKRSRWLS